MSALDTLAFALHSACLRDLPDLIDPAIDLAAERKYLDTLSQDQRAIYYKEKRRALSGVETTAFFNARNIAYSTQPRRPHRDACTVTLFGQTWPNTGLGYDMQGGLVGQAFTHAYTAIVRCDTTGCAAVYFGANPLAYLVLPEQQNTDAWMDAMAERQMPGQRHACELGWKLQ